MPKEGHQKARRGEEAKEVSQGGMEGQWSSSSFRRKSRSNAKQIRQ
jgi:hypothetical protein